MSQTEPSDTLEGRSEPLSPAVDSINDVSDETRALLSELVKDGPEAAPEPKEEQSEPEPEPEEAIEEEEYEEEDDPEEAAFEGAFEKLRQREAELDARREELRAAEEEVRRFQERNSGFKQDPTGMVKHYLAEAMGVDINDESVNDAYRELYKQMTPEMLGVDAGTDAKALAETRRLKGELDAYKKKQAEEIASREEEQHRREYEYKAAAAAQNIQGYIEEAAHEYPFLVAGTSTEGEPNAGDVVFSLMEEMVKADPDNEPDLREAAEMVEEYYRNRAEAFASVQHLLTQEESDEQDDDYEEQTRPERKRAKASPTLTNAGAARAAKPEPEEYIEDNNEAHAATIAKIGKLIRQSNE